MQRNSERKVRASPQKTEDDFGTINELYYVSRGQKKSFSCLLYLFFTEKIK